MAAEPARSGGAELATEAGRRDGTRAREDRVLGVGNRLRSHGLRHCRQGAAEPLGWGGGGSGDDWAEGEGEGDDKAGLVRAGRGAKVRVGGRGHGDGDGRARAIDRTTVAGEFVRRGCTVFLYDHTEYTRNRAFQTLRASLYDHVRRCAREPESSLCAHRRAHHAQVASGYLLKSDVEELIGRITLAHSLQEALEKSQARCSRPAAAAPLALRRAQVAITPPPSYAPTPPPPPPPHRRLV